MVVYAAGADIAHCICLAIGRYLGAAVAQGYLAGGTHIQKIHLTVGKVYIIVIQRVT